MQNNEKQQIRKYDITVLIATATSPYSSTYNILIVKLAITLIVQYKIISRGYPTVIRYCDINVFSPINHIATNNILNIKIEL